MRATNPVGNLVTVRGLRRPFRVGGDTSYTLPAPVGNPQWTVTATSAQIRWSQLPVTGAINELLDGTSGDGKGARYELDLTQAFVAATAPTQAVVDTSISGFQPAWRIDLAMPYNRSLLIQRIADGITTSLSIDEFILP